MDNKEKSEKIDYQKTLFLPKTNFPMRACLSEKEPVLLKKWEEIDLWGAIRREAAGRPLRILHDGPPYANGDIHIGHALNKILKDMVVRSLGMMGYDSIYVPGWDCHGLPIEWKIEEKYREKKTNKNEVPIKEFRQECRSFAEHWMNMQKKQFQRLGVMGDFSHPYNTMMFHSEARIAEELLKFAMSDQIFRGSKPVMWSVVERTALAEAEIEYAEYESDTVWVQFHFSPDKLLASDLQDSCVVIWTTTPWTIPGNRAVAFSASVAYGLYEVISTEHSFGPQKGDSFVLARGLAEKAAATAHLELKCVRSVLAEELERATLIHPFQGLCGGYDFIVPLLSGSHVTEECGSGFVHTAPGHGCEDFELWMSSRAALIERGIDVALPFMVDDAGFLTNSAPGFGPCSAGGAARIINDEGKKGDANERIIQELIKRKALFARGRLKHSYPHSWRSRKPVIFRNTPQWFIHMDKDLGDKTTLRTRALASIEKTSFFPVSGKKRLHSMVSERPDWVISRQRAWGVPISLFVDKDGNCLKDQKLNERIVSAFEQEGADAWFDNNAKERFLGNDYDLESWSKVTDILDVWFDSGTTHAFVLETRKDLKWPADIYLEGSDQHRGWFQSSLLESCGTRGRAPFNIVVTHGFTLDEKGRKMSKSLGNTISPQEIIEKSGADILRLWVASIDYQEDQRLGKDVMQTSTDTYRKLRNTIRWMLGMLSHETGEENISWHEMPELERLMLHNLGELDNIVRQSYDKMKFKNVVRALTDFIILDLSSFYFDIRKDSLYCDSPSSIKRKSAIKTIRSLFECLSIWLAPVLPFTMEEAWLEDKPDSRSIHLEQFPLIPQEWKDMQLSEKWHTIRQIRKVLTGALELARVEKKIGSSLEARLSVYVSNPEYYNILKNIDLAEVCIVSSVTLMEDSPPDNAFFLDEVKGVAAFVLPALGQKCARSWSYTHDVGSDREFPDVSARDAKALRELGVNSEFSCKTE